MAFPTTEPSDPPPAYNGADRDDLQIENGTEGTEPLLATDEARIPRLVAGSHGREEREPELPPDAVGGTDSTRSSIEMEDLQREDPLEDDEETGLTEEARNARRTQKLRRRDLDSRVAHEVDIEEEAAIFEGNQKFLRKVAVNGLLIALWYLFSICISVYNKWMFSPTNLDFHFPMFVTSVHMLVQFTLSSLTLLAFPKFRPKREFDDASAKHENKPKDTAKKPLMTPWFYLTRIVSCGTVTGLDIGLGNTSLKFITLSFFTMCKSSTLGFVLLFAILFKLEKPSWSIGAIITIMTIGVIMMVAGETAFDTLGFILLMLASICSGIRWSLTQILLRRTPATSNPFATLFFLTPVMFVALFLLAIPMEGFPGLMEGLSILKEKKGTVMGTLLMLFPGVLAFLMTTAEFTLLKRTSVVTLSVCGIFKEVLTISAAGIIFGDELTPINISGLCITLAAIGGYNWIRIKRMKKNHVEKALQRAEGQAARLSPERSAEDAPVVDGPGVKTGAIRRGATPKGHYSPIPNGGPIASGVDDAGH